MGQCRNLVFCVGRAQCHLAPWNKTVHVQFHHTRTLGLRLYHKPQPAGSFTMAVQGFCAAKLATSSRRETVLGLSVFQLGSLCTNQMCRNRKFVCFTKQWQHKQTWTASIARHIDMATRRLHLPVWTWVTSRQSLVASHECSHNICKLPAWMSPETSIVCPLLIASVLPVSQIEGSAIAEDNECALILGLYNVTFQFTLHSFLSCIPSCGQSQR